MDLYNMNICARFGWVGVCIRAGAKYMSGAIYPGFYSSSNQALLVITWASHEGLSETIVDYWRRLLFSPTCKWTIPSPHWKMHCETISTNSIRSQDLSALEGEEVPPPNFGRGRPTSTHSDYCRLSISFQHAEIRILLARLMNIKARCLTYNMGLHSNSKSFFICIPFRGIWYERKRGEVNEEFQY